MEHAAESDDVRLALEQRSFDRPAIKRVGRECYLVVSVRGHDCVLSRRGGGAQTFRHAWQIREWLQSQYGIGGIEIPVESL